ncbi:hypothetical protein [Companilactobacillus mishanensis]|uniref:Lipoprotein n=1 Tax=Companilactobacillus mishanensis TaxID=2486008 RepID=A0ABW9P7G6_9LACO|nr:hypothetical protein [Companilactobacillus mishanensis]MQS45106.1 hypothetical protein [Companilactobacillus mishanensis]
MQIFRKLGILLFTLIAMISLTACGGNKQSSETHDKTKQEKKVDHKDTDKKDSNTDDENDDDNNDQEQETDIKSSGQSSKVNKTPNVSKKVKNGTTYSSSHKATTTKLPAKSNTQSAPARSNVRMVANEDEASSLWAYANNVDYPNDYYRVYQVSNGFKMVPIDSYAKQGHSSFIMTFNGDAYTLNGKLISPFSKLAAPKDPEGTTHGWHGY